MSNSDFGIWAESLVAQYLKNKGYEILDRNYRKKWGEIDIVAEKDQIIIFVEVKANKSELAGFEPERRINPEKLRRLHRIIQTYLAYKKYKSDKEWQIDVVSLTVSRDRRSVKIKHFKNIAI